MDLDKFADVGQNSEKSGKPSDRMDLDKSGAPKDVTDVGQLTDRMDVDKSGEPSDDSDKKPKAPSDDEEASAQNSKCTVQ